MSTYKKTDLPFSSNPKYEILRLPLLAIVIILIYAGTLNNMAATLALKERYPDAIDYLKKALAINPTDENLHTNLGIIMKKQSDLDEARHHFHRALQLNPANKMAQRQLEEIERLRRNAVGD